MGGLCERQHVSLSHWTYMGLALLCLLQATQAMENKVEMIYLNSSKFCDPVNTFPVNKSLMYKVESHAIPFMECEVTFQSEDTDGRLCLVQGQQLTEMHDNNVELVIRDGMGNPEDRVMEKVEYYPDYIREGEYCTTSRFINMQLQKIHRNLPVDPSRVFVFLTVLDIRSKEREIFMDGDYCGSTFPLDRSEVSVSNRRTSIPGSLALQVTSMCGIFFRKESSSSNSSICMVYLPQGKPDCSSHWQLFISLKPWSMEPEDHVFTLRCSDEKVHINHAFCLDNTTHTLVMLAHLRGTMTIYSNQTEIERPGMYRIIFKDFPGGDADKLLKEVVAEYTNGGSDSGDGSDGRDDKASPLIKFNMWVGAGIAAALAAIAVSAILISRNFQGKKARRSVANGSAPPQAEAAKQLPVAAQYPRMVNSSVRQRTSSVSQWIHLGLTLLCMLQASEAIENKVENVYMNSYMNCGHDKTYVVNKHLSYEVKADAHPESKTHSFIECDLTFHSEDDDGRVCMLQLRPLTEMHDNNAELLISDGLGNPGDRVIKKVQYYPDFLKEGEYCTDTRYMNMHLFKLHKHLKVELSKVLISLKVMDIKSPERQIYLDGDYCDFPYPLQQSEVTVFNRRTMEPGEIIRVASPMCAVTFTKAPKTSDRSICLVYLPQGKPDCSSPWTLYLSLRDYSLAEQDVVYTLSCHEEKAQIKHAFCLDGAADRVMLTHVRSDSVYINQTTLERPGMYRVIITDFPGGDTNQLLQKVEAELASRRSGNKGMSFQSFSMWWLFIGLGVAVVVFIAVAIIYRNRRNWCCRGKQKRHSISSNRNGSSHIAAGDDDDDDDDEEAASV